jgi:hypothetical protein
MEREHIAKRLLEIEIEINEVLQRLPAHSVKPPVMMELLALEDERDLLQHQLAQMTE